MTDIDHEALDLLHATTNRGDLVLDFTMAAGEAVVANRKAEVVLARGGDSAAWLC